MAECTLNSPIALGTVDRLVVDGFGFIGLQTVSTAVAEIVLRQKTATNELRYRRTLTIQNGNPLPMLDPPAPDTYANSTPNNYATQIFLAVKSSTNNPDDEILSWLVTNGVLDGTLTP